MKGLKIVLSTIALLLLCATFVEAQTKSKKKPVSAAAKKKAREEEKKKNEESFWTTKMWYGADINYPTLYNGFFNMSLSPRAAYKINNRFSAGVVFKTDYSWYRIDDNPDIRKYENFDYGAGIFARARIFNGLFAQAELERSYFKIMPYYDSSINKIVTTKISHPYCYLGLGWSSGFGKWQSQVAINRNVLDDIGYVRGAWDFKLGFTYNF